ncbi:MAG: acyltransferase [Pseudomonadales bacterium]|nr:acyltransferase [Pseudomonadales bacterium]
MSPAVVDFLNLSRFLAALAVLISHVRAFLLVDYGSVEDPHPLTSILYFLSGFGPEAVLVFFVISGYLVGGKVIQRMTVNKFNAMSYAIDRFSRLYSVYVFALLFTLVCDTVGSKLTPALYDGSYQSQLTTVNGSFVERNSVSTFLGNLFMLQTIVVPTFGSNGPLWSLAFETTYYILGPVVIWAAIQEGSTRLVFVPLVFIIAWILPPFMLFGFLLWFAGALLARVKIGSVLLVVVGLLLLLAMMLLNKLYVELPWYLHKVLVPFGFFVLLAGVTGLGAGIWRSQMWRKLAEFSYSTYLLHYPLVVILCAILGFFGLYDPGEKMQPSGFSAILVLIFTLVSLATAWLLARITEGRTPEFRAFLKRRIVTPF